MIEVKHLECSFGKKEILSDISFAIADGTFTAILGANGCGKTTLLRCIAGLLTPQHGTVTIDERTVGDYNARERAQRIALVGQHPQTDIEFSAFETVLMGRNPYQRHLQNESQEDWDIVEKAMRQTNTWHLRFALPSEMSGGELQRVMIARALAQATPLLLMDEPVSNLDIAHQIELMRLLGEADGRTVLIVIHDMNLALRFCQRLLLLHDGRLVYDGPTADGLTPENIARVYGVGAHLADGRIVLDY